jgi:hypothetical protein
MKKFIKENWLKIIAIVILVGALWNHPYSYFQILRWTVAVAGAYSAYTSFNSKNIFWGWVFVAVTILFNPIAPIYLQKDTWQTFDLIGAVVFSVSIFVKKKKI